MSGKGRQVVEPPSDPSRAGADQRPPAPRRRADSGPRYTPVELARLLRLPPPTAEQAAIIAAPVEPLLVVAGRRLGQDRDDGRRGWSGWSPTRTSRPDQILGLTFTRKAAGELAHRVRIRLGQLVRRLPARRPLTPARR